MPAAVATARTLSFLRFSQAVKFWRWSSIGSDGFCISACVSAVSGAFFIAIACILRQSPVI